VFYKAMLEFLMFCKCFKCCKHESESPRPEAKSYAEEWETIVRKNN